MKPSFRVLMLSCLFLSGCVSHRLLSTRSELDQVIQDGRLSPWWRGLYYCGSDQRYHYLLDRWEMRIDQCYEVPTNVLEVPSPFPRTRDRDRFVDVSNIETPTISPLQTRIEIPVVVDPR